MISDLWLIIKWLAYKQGCDTPGLYITTKNLQYIFSTLVSSYEELGQKMTMPVFFPERSYSTLSKRDKMNRKIKRYLFLCLTALVDAHHFFELLYQSNYFKIILKFEFILKCQSLLKSEVTSYRHSKSKFLCAVRIYLDKLFCKVRRWNCFKT